MLFSTTSNIYDTQNRSSSNKLIPQEPNSCCGCLSLMTGVKLIAIWELIGIFLAWSFIMSMYPELDKYLKLILQIWSLIAIVSFASGFIGVILRDVKLLGLFNILYVSTSVAATCVDFSSCYWILYSPVKYPIMLALTMGLCSFIHLCFIIYCCRMIRKLTEFIRYNSANT